MLGDYARDPKTKVGLGRLDARAGGAPDPKTKVRSPPLMRGSGARRPGVGCSRVPRQKSENKSEPGGSWLGVWVTCGPW
eukprot:scaffold1825_cov112-Isochrysis_galbana.AAC.4